jgi:hypothetical protein
VWVAGNSEAAWLRFVLLVLGVLGIPALLATTKSLTIRNGGRVERLSAIALLAAFGGALLTVVQLGGNLLTRDIAAGALVILIPLGAIGVLPVDRQGDWARGKSHARFGVTLFCLMAALVGLVLTGERSAWLALSVALLLGLACHLWLDIGAKHRGSTLPLFATVALSSSLLCVLVVTLLVVLIPASTQPLASWIERTPYDRFAIMEDLLLLLQDFRYTGGGLAQTPIVLSTYVFLFHVPFLYQAYNLPLQIGLEQGLPGLIAFAGLVTAALLSVLATYDEGRPHTRRAATLTLVSLLGLLMHGALDAALYSSGWQPLIFVPMAVAITLPMPRRTRKATGYSALTYAVGLMPPVLVASLFLLPHAEAAWHANLGAVRQSQAELGVYVWPQWPIQDAVRRSQAVDLVSAQMHYGAALALDEESRTAHLRLGQIALSRGEYELARQHLEAAHRAAPKQRITRQLLGELYAITGDTAAAVTMWHEGDTDPHKLELRHWWYTHLGETQQAAWMDAAILRYKESL